MTGTIKKIMPDNKKFGFISRPGEEKDLFFHESGLVGVTLSELKEGDEVTFDVQPAQEGGKGPSAVNVSRA
jgi:CspA family cold shock protein